MKTTKTFAQGFRAGFKLWNAGHTFEAIQHDAEGSPAADDYAAGMFASAEALAGWLDDAERKARTCGMTRDAAAALVQEARGV